MINSMVDYCNSASTFSNPKLLAEISNHKNARDALSKLGSLYEIQCKNLDAVIKHLEKEYQDRFNN